MRRRSVDEISSMDIRLMEYFESVSEEYYGGNSNPKLGGFLRMFIETAMVN
jgi:hypothetical protein